MLEVFDHCNAFLWDKRQGYLQSSNLQNIIFISEMLRQKKQLVFVWIGRSTDVSKSLVYKFSSETRLIILSLVKI